MAAISVPVVVDAVKTLEAFPFSRCVYYTMECEEPSADWMLGIEGVEVPYLLVELSGVIHAPSAEQAEFDSGESIEAAFARIDADPRLSVGSADLWLPNEVLYEPSKGAERRRGRVYRVGQGLFLQALQFRRGALSQEEFLEVCRTSRDQVRFSAVETRAFREWVEGEVRQAKEAYPKAPELALWKEGGDAPSASGRA